MSILEIKARLLSLGFSRFWAWYLIMIWVDAPIRRQSYFEYALYMDSGAEQFRP